MVEGSPSQKELTRDIISNLSQGVNNLISSEKEGVLPIIDPKSKVGKTLLIVQKRAESGAPIDLSFLEKRMGRLDDLWEDEEISDEAYGLAGAPLVEAYIDLSSFLTPEQKALEGAAQVMEKSAKVQEKVATGEFGLRLPKGEKEQRELVRRLLQDIESSPQDCYDRTNALQTQKIEAAIDRMHPNVALETTVRLALHDSSRLISQAEGWIVRPRGQEVEMNIGRAVQEAERRGHGIKRMTVSTLLKTGLEGMAIAEAWDQLQHVNFHYFEVLEEADPEFAEEEAKKIKKNKNSKFILRDDDVGTGKVEANYYADPDEERKAKVDNWMIEKIKEEIIKQEREKAEEEGRAPREMGGQELQRNAETSLKLAFKLAEATFETSIWNRTAMAGNDQLGEMIGFKGWRRGRKLAGRARGPQKTETCIEGFGNSLLRHLSQNTEIEKPFNAKDVKIDRIEEGSQVYFGTVILFRLYSLKELLLDRSPEPGSVDKTMIQKAIPYFATADPASAEDKKNGFRFGPNSLPEYWILGLVDMALSTPKLGWTRQDLLDLHTALTRENIFTEPIEGANPNTHRSAFFEKEIWDWIEEETKLKSRLGGLAVRRKQIGTNRR